MTNTSQINDQRGLDHHDCKRCLGFTVWSNQSAAQQAIRNFLREHIRAVFRRAVRLRQSPQNLALAVTRDYTIAGEGR